MIAIQQIARYRRLLKSDAQNQTFKTTVCHIT